MLDAKSTSLMTTLTYKEKSSLLHVYFITFFFFNGLNKEQIFCPKEIFSGLSRTR